MGIDLAAFLNRIGHPGTVNPDLATLRALHWAHLQEVPFENLDIRPLGLPISLSIPDIEAKIVDRRRGGFCYELNGLLAEVLTRIGFAVTRISVWFVLEDGSLTPPFDHMALLVRIPNDPQVYFCDVGCANSSPAYPLRLIEGEETFHPETGSTYRFVRDGALWRFDMHGPDATWKPQHFFGETPYELADFSARCRHQYTAPDSHFMKGPICTKNVYGGRITLSGNSLIRTNGSDRSEEPIAGDDELRDMLKHYFEIAL